MAYAVTFASVPQEQIDSIRRDPIYVLAPTHFEHVSNMLSYGSEDRPLGQYLQQVTVGGEILCPQFWHPFRPPKVYFSHETEVMRQRLADLWNDDQREMTERDVWLDTQIGQLLRIMDQETLVTAMGMPGLAKQAARTRIPWLPMPTSIPQEKSWWQFW